MINHTQLRQYVIKPPLLAIGHYSPEDEEMLMSICSQETEDGFYLHQTVGGKNAALGIFQMQPDTHDDIWEKLKDSHIFSFKIMKTLNFDEKPTADMMVYNLWYAAIMARLFWLHVKQPMPAINDSEGRWELYKKYWNTVKGKATKEEFMANYQRYVKGD